MTDAESSRVTIDLTGEVVLNPKALPDYLDGCMRYRIEYWVPGQTFPDELGYVYLPPEADVVAVINAMNGREVYVDSRVKQRLDEARRLLEELSKMEPGITTAINDGRRFVKLDWCLFCGADYDLDGNITHEVECLWACTRAFLGVDDG